MYNRRLIKVRNKFKKNSVPYALVSRASDIIYFTGFYTERALLLFRRTGCPVFLVDKMNYALAVKQMEGVRVEVVFGDKIKKVKGCLAGDMVKVIGIDKNDMAVSLYLELKKVFKKMKVCEISHVIQEMRSLKDGEEIKSIRKAAKETVKVWGTVKKQLEPGMTEKKIASIIDIAIKEKGLGNSFATISAVGPNTADPHAIPSNRKLDAGSHLLVDFGLKYNGYCSDLTRVWAKSRMNRKIDRLYVAVKTVHDKVIAGLKPGARIGSIVKKANKYFIDNNLGKYISHGLGHGVGIDVHELPFLGEFSKSALKKDMIITIEPGLYVPGVGGIRIEDMVLITAKGCEVLTV